MRIAPAAAVLAFVAVAPLHAQRVTRFATPTRALPAVTPTPRPDVLIESMVGVLSFVPGALVGGVAGVVISDCSHGGGEFCGLEGAVMGMVAGGSLSIPVGVHLVNHRRGNLGLSMLVSALIGGASIGSAYATNGAAGLVIGPVLSVVSSVIIENVTASRRAAPAR